MRYLKPLLYIILLFVFCRNGFSQATYIKGRVVNAKNNAPLLGANVIIKGTTTGTITTETGDFTLAASSVDKITIMISHAGYTSIEKEVDPLADSTYRFYLEEAFIDLNTVVITATRTEKNLKNVPILTQVISSKQIEYISRNSIQDVLGSYVPDIQYTKANFGRRMGMHNLDAKYILFLVDGERVAGELYGNIDYERINVNDVEHIEIIKGASSSLYGSNAIGGVINIITKEVKEPFEASVNTHYSRFNDWNTTGHIGFKTGMLTSKTDVGYKTMDGYDLNDNSTMTMNPYSGYMASQKFSISPVKKLNVQVKGGYYTLEKFDNDLIPTHQKYDDIHSHIKADYSYSEKNKTEISWNSDRYRTFEVYEQIDWEDSVTYSDQLNSVRIISHLAIASRQYLSLGTEWVNEKMISNRIEGTQKRAEDWIVFAQDDITITSRLTSIIGFRINNHSAFGFHATPQFSILYDASPFKIRSSYSAGYKVPTLKELYMQFSPAPGVDINGNKDLKPELSKYYSVSLEYSKPLLNASIILYHNRLKDMIMEIRPDSDTNVWIYQNINKAQITGIETSLGTKLPYGFSLQLAYNYNDIVDNATDKQVWGRYKHSGVVTITHLLKRRQYHLTISIHGKYIGETYYNEVDEMSGTKTDYYLPAHMLWRIVTTQSVIPGITLSLGVDNIFNVIKPEHYIWLHPGRRYVAGLSLDIHKITNKIKRTKL